MCITNNEVTLTILFIHGFIDSFIQFELSSYQFLKNQVLSKFSTFNFENMIREAIDTIEVLQPFYNIIVNI